MGHKNIMQINRVKYIFDGEILMTLSAAILQELKQ